MATSSIPTSTRTAVVLWCGVFECLFACVIGLLGPRSSFCPPRVDIDTLVVFGLGCWSKFISIFMQHIQSSESSRHYICLSWYCRPPMLISIALPTQGMRLLFVCIGSCRPINHPPPATAYCETACLCSPFLCRCCLFASICLPAHQSISKSLRHPLSTLSTLICVMAWRFVSLFQHLFTLFYPIVSASDGEDSSQHIYTSWFVCDLAL